MSAATVYPPRKRFTRCEAQEILDAGLFPGQRLELIDGDLINKSGQKPPHAHTIHVVGWRLIQLFGAMRVQNQFPIEAGAADREWNWPEPDLSVLTAFNDEYRHRHPRGDELALAIEVADTTIWHDTTTKRDLYARAGVPEYWVLDINSRRLILHKNPLEGKFQEVVTLPESASVSVGGVQIAISELLP